MGGTVMWLKRLVRPLIPNRVMARFRLHQHSKEARINVDVVVPDRSAARRWARATPDTYRAIVEPALPADGGGPATVSIGDPAGCDRAGEVLARSVDLDVAVVARVSPPRLVGRRRTEPEIEPLAVAARGEAATVVTGGSDDPIEAVHRLRGAGFGYLLVPIDGAPAPARRDPILRPVVVVLAAVPMYDVGGGSRGSQLAQEMLARGLHVVYVSLFGSNESVDLGLRTVHPDLEEYRFDGFDAGALVPRTESAGVVVVEVPAPPFLPVVEALRDAGWQSVYDIIDLWSDRALGGEWYRQQVEQRFVTESDLVIGSARDLVDRVAAARSDAQLVPNGVNARLFGRSPTGGVPDDLPRGSGPLLGYHGSLYGDWFDWEALRDVAAAFESARVVLIGDVPAAHPELPPNVTMLGLKPQHELPAYVAAFDVGLLPFVVSDTTHAVSPLKVFEYLASGVPVAAPPLRALEGLDVHVADRLVEAVRDALDADRPDRDAALAAHSWAERVDSMLRPLGVTDVEPAGPVAIVRRPVRHHRRDERLVR